VSVKEEVVVECVVAKGMLLERSQKEEAKEVDACLCVCVPAIVLVL
jgi:hypothetical protein